MKAKWIFQRTLFQYFKKQDWEEIKPFIEFEKSSVGKKIIKEGGY